MWWVANHSLHYLKCIHIVSIHGLQQALQRDIVHRVHRPSNLPQHLLASHDQLTTIPSPFFNNRILLIHIHHRCRCSWRLQNFKLLLHGKLMNPSKFNPFWFVLHCLFSTSASKNSTETCRIDSWTLVTYQIAPPNSNPPEFHQS